MSSLCVVLQRPRSASASRCLLAAASLTSTPPAIDVHADQVPLREIAKRMAPRWPRMSTPSVTELSQVTPLTQPTAKDLAGVLRARTVTKVEFTCRHRMVRIQSPLGWAGSPDRRNSGRCRQAIPLGARLAPGVPWFGRILLIRADAENWPLGPHGFWESFRVAEVAQHRVFVLLIVAFAIFEWGVQTRRVMPRRAALVFPAVCAVGGALLMTHSHALGNVKEELLAEWSHMPIAVLGVVAGCSRWLELRLPRHLNRIPAWIWPPCFVFIGLILVLYRES